MLAMILSWFGGGPLKAILDALTKAHADAINGATEQERTAAKERVDTLTELAADAANARQAASTYPTWMGVIGFMVGFGFALHLLLVALATTFQPLIVGGWLDWMLRIPKLPPPLDASEVGLIGFYFGAMSVTAVAGAIAKRK